jgi:O-antigen/teichoic acid export membrane protein
MNNHAQVSRTYHHGSKLMSVAVLPLTFSLAFFSKEILQLWSSDPEVVANAYLIISLLVAGNALNGLMHMPYALQLANGWTSLAFYSNLVAVIVLVPVIIIAVSHWGAVGAAGAWILLNTGYLLITVQIMHRRLLKTEKWQWYLRDVATPLLLVLLLAGTGRVMMDTDLDTTQEFIALLVILCLTTGAAAGSSVYIRKGLLRQFYRPG